MNRAARSSGTPPTPSKRCRTRHRWLPAMPNRTRQRSIDLSHALPPKCTAEWDSPTCLACTTGSNGSDSTGRSWVGQKRSGRRLRHFRAGPKLRDVSYKEIGRAHVELQSLMRISYAVFCLKKKQKEKH